MSIWKSSSAILLCTVCVGVFCASTYAMESMDDALCKNFQKQALSPFQQLGVDWIDRGFMHGNVFNDRHPTARYLGRRRLWSLEEIEASIKSDRPAIPDVGEVAKAAFEKTQAWIKKKQAHKHQYETRNVLMMNVLGGMQECQWGNGVSRMDRLQGFNPSKLSDAEKTQLQKIQQNLEAQFPAMMGLEGKTRARANARHTENKVEAWAAQYSDLLKRLTVLQKAWLDGAQKIEGSDGFSRWSFGENKKIVPAIGYVFNETQQTHLSVQEALISTYVMANCTADATIQQQYVDFLNQHQEITSALIQEWLTPVQDPRNVVSFFQAEDLALRNGLIKTKFTASVEANARLCSSYREKDQSWIDALETLRYDKRNERLYPSREFKNALKDSFDTTDSTGGTAYVKGALFDGDLHPKDALAFLLRQSFVNGDSGLVTSIFQRFPEEVSRVLGMGGEPASFETHIELQSSTSPDFEVPQLYMPKEVSRAIQENDRLVAGPHALASQLGLDGMRPRPVWQSEEGQRLKSNLLKIFSNMPTSKGPGLWSKALLSHQPTPDQIVMCLVRSSLITHDLGAIDALEINGEVERLAPKSCVFIQGPLDSFRKKNSDLIQGLAMSDNKGELKERHGMFAKRVVQFIEDHKETIDAIVEAPVREMFQGIKTALGHPDWPDMKGVGKDFAKEWSKVWDAREKNWNGSKASWEDLGLDFHRDLVRCFYLYGRRPGGGSKEGAVERKEAVPERALSWIVAGLMPYISDRGELQPSRLSRLTWFYEKHKETFKA